MQCNQFDQRFCKRIRYFNQTRFYSRLFHKKYNTPGGGGDLKIQFRNSGQSVETLRLNQSTYHQSALRNLIDLFKSSLARVVNESHVSGHKSFSPGLNQVQIIFPVKEVKSQVICMQSNNEEFYLEIKYVNITKYKQLYCQILTTFCNSMGRASLHVNVYQSNKKILFVGTKC